MTIDNFNIVTPSDQGDFFFVQVMQRNKEKNNVSSSVIKDYHFFDKETFLSKKEEITTLCKAFNAYFWVNPRNCKEVQYEIIREAIEPHKLFKCGALGRKRCNKYKSKWILDFDTKDWSLINKYLEINYRCRPDGVKVNTFTKTIHVISDPFDLEQFNQKVAKLDNIDIQSNSSLLFK